jgi:hypothetical protein
LNSFPCVLRECIFPTFLMKNNEFIK